MFQIIGDAFCAAFHTAPDGLAAAIAAQRALTREPWADAVPIRVRMAVHTGTADLRAGDYIFTAPGNRHAVHSEGGCVIVVNVPEEVEILKEIT